MNHVRGKPVLHEVTDDAYEADEVFINITPPGASEGINYGPFDSVIDAQAFANAMVSFEIISEELATNGDWFTVQ